MGGCTSLPDRIYSAARDLLLSLLKERASLEVYPATKVGVSVTNLIKESSGQQISVFELLDEKEHVLVSTVDALKNKYGEKAITRCSLLGLRGRYLGVPRSEIGIF